MQYHFEQVDVEGEEYEAWDAVGTPLQLSVQKGAEWLQVEPRGTPAPRELADAIREFARLEAVQWNRRLWTLEISQALWNK